ncbi:hypothetical protein EZS27_034900 [termite gut metagenome]|uniref:Uncharacterized protein n=1 Tax=termite gut metagenome TaxID=433724 RepID=A0A5J4Q0F2_9ZZZZ
MIQQLLRKAAGFSKSLFDTVSKMTIISLCSYRMRFANHMIVLLKGSNKTLPIIRADTSEGNTRV